MNYLAKGHTVSTWGNPDLQAFSKTLKKMAEFLYLKVVCHRLSGM